ncbi:ABC transporter permease [Nocardiopsis sp. JB363]|uniref:ABC transporter permease n=1 Tax=Nocardiopsis sp. JB363 TaxID=1434837 RepID=UPI00097A8A28|nr:ABC transporter permease [Nocardiopsis sp. JB363]SIO86739.1 L-proline glycine betaine ABC transport system permease protein ProW (TC 3.A.1.12.1) [Nocardiopsis sp. JB363]
MIDAWEWATGIVDWAVGDWSHPGEPDRGILARLVEHMRLSYVSILIGLVIALPLGVACVRWSPVYPPVLTGVNVLYAVPSIALFFLMLPYTGFSDWTAIIPLALYTLVILLPNVVDGLRQVPEHVRQAAVAMGFGPMRRLVFVELPVAVPVIIAGLRVASVATISMVSVASLVGLGGLGQLIVSEGFRRRFDDPIVVGIVLTVVLALVTDALLVIAQRLLTPWAHAGKGLLARKRAARAEATAVAGDAAVTSGTVSDHRESP